MPRGSRHRPREWRLRSNSSSSKGSNQPVHRLKRETSQSRISVAGLRRILSSSLMQSDFKDYSPVITHTQRRLVGHGSEEVRRVT